MRKSIFILILMAGFITAPLFSGSKEKGEKCNIDIECKFQLTCKEGVCVKKAEFDYGSGKSGKQCNIDADCIGSGKCNAGKSGKKYCTG